jgi:hypothetical protein
MTGARAFFGLAPGTNAPLAIMAGFGRFQGRPSAFIRRPPCEHDS